MGKSMRPGQTAPRDDGAQLQLIADYMPGMSVVYDQNLRCIFSTRRYAEFFGHTTASIIGNHLREIVGEGAYQEVKPYFERALAGNRATYERAHPLESGELCHLEVELNPCIGQDGRVHRLFSVMTDVSERKRTEDALRRNEEHFRELVELSSDRYWEQDENFRFTRFSSGLVRGRTYDEKHLLGKTRWELDLRLEPGQNMAAHRATLEAHLPFYDFEYAARIDGSLAYFSASGIPLFDDQGKFTGYRGVGSNITARKLAEQALRVSEARFRSLTELSSDWYSEQDENFRFTLRLPKVAKAGVLDEQDILGKTRWELGITPEPGHDLAAHRAAHEAHLPFRDFELSMMVKGSRRYISVSGIPQFDGRGRFTGYCSVGRNITARKEAEYALRESEQRFRDLTELSSDWYWEQDDQFRFTYRSQDIHGSGVAPEEVLGKRRWELDGVDAKDAIWASHKATLEAHQPFRDFEFRRRIPNGELRYISTSGIPVFSDQGAFIGYRGVVRHITERKRAELALLQSEQRFRDLTELSSEWYWEQDENFRFSLLSPNWGLKSGMSAESVLGKTRWELPISGLSEEQWQAHRAMLARREPFREFVYQMVSTTGVNHWYSVSGNPMFGADGQFLGYRGTSHDITTRVNAERALRESEAQLREAQRMARLGSWKLDLVNDELTWSEEIFRIFEIDPAHAGVSREAFRAAVHPADRNMVNEAFTRSIREHTPYEITHRLLMPDGRIKHVHEHAQTVYDACGQPLLAVGTVQDVSQQKQVEAELRIYAKRLENLTRRLGEAQEVERRRLAAELHDGVCSNLAAIGLNLALLQKQLLYGDAASMQRRFSDLIALIDEAKANAKDISVDLRPLLLEERDLFSALEEYARKFEGSTGIEVRVKPANSAPRLPPEEKIALFRITQEALTNCAKHAQARVAEIEFNTDEGHLVYSVADDGVGIDLTGANGAKSGLGLLSMQERAESIGATWKIESTPGKGTRVVVSLVAAAA